MATIRTIQTSSYTQHDITAEAQVHAVRLATGRYELRAEDSKVVGFLDKRESGGWRLTSFSSPPRSERHDSIATGTLVAAYELARERWRKAFKEAAERGDSPGVLRAQIEALEFTTADDDVEGRQRLADKRAKLQALLDQRPIHERLEEAMVARRAAYDELQAATAKHDAARALHERLWYEAKDAERAELAGTSSTLTQRQRNDVPRAQYEQALAECNRGHGPSYSPCDGHLRPYVQDAEWDAQRCTCGHVEHDDTGAAECLTCDCTAYELRTVQA